MLQNELQILTELNHPNIMSVKRLLKDTKRYYIITEILEGGELWDLFLKREHFSEKDAAHIIR
jgi:calcium-dependent protein kinase